MVVVPIFQCNPNGLLQRRLLPYAMRKMEMEHYDHIVVGSGAGGSAAAYRLAQAAHRVLFLEKGEKLPDDGRTQIGRASCRERVCQYVSISVVAGSLKKTTTN